MLVAATKIVMPGLDPGIRHLCENAFLNDGWPVKPGHDDWR